MDVRKLREQTTQILQLVSEQGVEIQITCQGSPIARLVPLQRKRARTHPRTTVWTNLDELAAEIGAHWSDATSVADTVRTGRREL
jgi:antitoxin (DNA-binding transcriptional repressor) of toxin-antitoxin stability system